MSKDAFQPLQATPDAFDFWNETDVFSVRAKIDGMIAELQTARKNWAEKASAQDGNVGRMNFCARQAMLAAMMIENLKELRDFHDGT